MHRYFLLLSCVGLILTAAPVFAQDVAADVDAPEVPAIVQQQGMIVTEGYSYATALNQKNGAAFLIVSNVTEEHDRLIGASSDVASKTVIHSMSENDKGVMEMREIEGVDIPLGNTIALGPDGNHIMFMGLKSPLKAEEKFKLTLTFENAGDVETEVKIRAPYEAKPVAENDNVEKGDIDTPTVIEEIAVDETVAVPVPEEEMAQPEGKAPEPVKPAEKKKSFFSKLLGK